MLHLFKRKAPVMEDRELILAKDRDNMGEIECLLK